VPARERPAVKREIEVELRPKLVDASGVWVADYVRLRFMARKPPET
jgi:hypothetical protein